MKEGIVVSSAVTIQYFARSQNLNKSHFLNPSNGFKKRYNYKH